jgi:hypothetical protein
MNFQVEWDGAGYHWIKHFDDIEKVKKAIKYLKAHRCKNIRIEENEFN